MLPSLLKKPLLIKPAGTVGGGVSIHVNRGEPE